MLSKLGLLHWLSDGDDYGDDDDSGLVTTIIVMIMLVTKTSAMTMR